MGNLLVSVNDATFELPEQVRANLADPALNVAPTVRPPSMPEISWINTFQSDHGWYLPFGGTGVMENDTTTFVMGTQSLRFTQPIQKNSLGLNLTGRTLVAWVNVAELSGSSEYAVYAATDTTLASYYQWKIIDGNQFPASPLFRIGEWALITLPFQSATVTGTPSPASIGSIRIRPSAAGSLRINAIGSIPTGTTYPQGVVSITFDDGWASDLTAARRSLSPRGLRATSYIIPPFIGGAGRLSEAGVRELNDVHGWDLQAHGATVYTTMTDAQLRAEWTATKEWFAARGLGRPDHLAYVGGQTNDAVVRVAREFFTSARTIAPYHLETWPPPMPHRLRARSGISSLSIGHNVAGIKAEIDKAVAGGHWVILVFHKIVEGAPADVTECSRADLEAIADYIAASPIRCATVDDVMGPRRA